MEQFPREELNEASEKNIIFSMLYCVY